MSQLFRAALAAALALTLAACGKTGVAELGNPSTDALPGLPDTSPNPFWDGGFDAEVLTDRGLPDEDLGVGDDGETRDFGPNDPDAGEDDSGEPVLHDAFIGVDAIEGTDAEDPADATSGTDAALGTDAQTNADAAVLADSGVPPAPECTVDQDCGFFGHCEPVSQTCVDCLVDQDCPGQRVCDTAHGFVCRSPCFNGQCGPLGFCEPVTNTCVECTMTSQCDTGEVCNPATLSCVECATNADCALHVGEPVCDTAAQECVACLTNSDCPSPQECINGIGPNYCANPTNRGLCEPCENDDDCGGVDDLCVGYLGPTGIFDRSCSIDCAANPMGCPSGFECISVRNNSAMQCRPRYEMNTPTCEATRHLGESCDATELDPGCGLEGTQDARCFSANMSSIGVCTVWCFDNADCANGTTCTGANPPMQEGNCL